MNYFFTGDEHYYHHNILRYCDRKFSSVEEMNETLIQNHNSVVGKKDITIHAGDFTLIKDKKIIYENIINRLNGNHIFLKGSHDYWIPRKGSIQIWEKNINVGGNKYYFVVCHYAMHTWHKSHYNSFHLFAHSHGKLNLDGKRYDLGVDNNNFFPLSATQIVEIMKNRPDNPNLIKKN